MSDIMSVSRLRLGSDGDGIRTLVGFYGCPLNCRYCANRHCHNLETPCGDFTAGELVDILSLDEPYFFYDRWRHDVWRRRAFITGGFYS